VSGPKTAVEQERIAVSGCYRILWSVSERGAGGRGAGTERRRGLQNKPERWAAIIWLTLRCSAHMLCYWTDLIFFSELWFIATLTVTDRLCTTRIVPSKYPWHTSYTRPYRI